MMDKYYELMLEKQRILNELTLLVLESACENKGHPIGDDGKCPCQRGREICTEAIS